ncbi:MAG TPA: hypothetical protein VFX49_10045 [Chloroflexota bacterium]|nr:hypothetical protein [Chloroflexota bacterium]
MNKRRKVALKKRRKTRERLKTKERAARQATPGQAPAAPPRRGA